MQIYLASRFGRAEELVECADEIKALGHSVCSSWLYHPPTVVRRDDDKLSREECRTISSRQFSELKRADLLILFSEIPDNIYGRGGRHFEAGIVFGRGKDVWVVGCHENLFHWHNKLEVFSTWEDCKKELQAIALTSYEKCVREQLLTDPNQRKDESSHAPDFHD